MLKTAQEIEAFVEGVYRTLCRTDNETAAAASVNDENYFIVKYDNEADRDADIAAITGDV